MITREQLLGDARQREGVAGVVRAMAEPQRLRILMLLQDAPDGLRPMDLQGPLGLSQPTVSHHLRILQAAGLVTGVKVSVFVYYTINRAGLKLLMQQLSVITGIRTLK